MAVMWWSWPKFAFNKCEFQLPNLFECKCCSIGLRNMKTGSASCVVPNKCSEPKTCWVTLNAFVGNWGPAASLLEMTWFLLLLKLFVLYVQYSSYDKDSTVNSHSTKRYLKRSNMMKRSKFEHHRMRIHTLSHVVCVWGCDGVWTRIWMVSDLTNFPYPKSDRFDTFTSD